MNEEPIIHSHITDGLPDKHPLAYESIHCKKCGEMLHAFNNEEICEFEVWNKLTQDERLSLLYTWWWRK